MLRAAAGGQGSMVLLSGEPGIGKTRTCEELARAAEEMGVAFIWGRCWDAGGAPAYWPWTQILQTLLASVPDEISRRWLEGPAGRIAPLLPDAPDGCAAEAAGGRFEILRGIVDVLEHAARSRPLLLLLDDLHSADEASLLVLEFLARHLPQVPIMVVAAYRDSNVPADAMLPVRLPDILRQPGVQALIVRPLDLVEVEALAQKITGQSLSVNVTLTLHRLTDGNPLFLLECLRALRLEDNLKALALGRTPLPAGLRSAISRHLAPLSPDARSILRAAAVLGREFAIVTLRRMIHYPDDVLLTALLDEAVETEVLTPDAGIAGRYRFVHTLVREVLYAELTGVEQLRYHHDAATVLMSSPGRNPDLAEIAHHFVEAARRGAEPEPAVRTARAAGDRAMRSFAYDDAERLYGLALDVIEHFGPDDQKLHADLLLAHGNACNHLGEIGRAKQSFERANELARALDLRDLAAEATLGHGEPLSFPEGGYVDHAYVAMLEDTLALWNGEAHPLHARLLARLATTLYFTDRVEQRRELCTRALEMARACGEVDALGQVLLATHTALWGPNPAERLEIADELGHLARRTGNRALAFSAHHWRYCDLLELGDIAGMENDFQACRALAGELREPAMLGWVDILRTGRAMWEGRFDECERLAGETLGLAPWLGNATQAFYFLQMFYLRGLQGRAGEMLEPMRMAAGLHPGIPALSIGLAFIHAEAGRLDEARPLAAEVVAHLDRYPPDINFISTLSCLGLVCARLDDPALTAPVYELMRPYDGLSIVIGNGLGYGGAAAHWLGVMATCLRRFDDAAAHFERALAAESAMAAPPWIAVTQYEYAVMLLRRGGTGDRQRAIRLIKAAAATGERLGMAQLVERTGAAQQNLAKNMDSDAPVALTPAAYETGRCVFRSEGDFWTVEYDHRILRLRNSRGLHYLSQLLRHPHREFLVLDLAVDSAESAADCAPPALTNGGDSGATIADRRAIAEYRRRIDEVRGELAEAESNNDSGRALPLREEMEKLVEQLGSAVGFRGRQRPMSSDLERARSAVTKRIHDAVRKLADEHPTLGHHLIACIQTGYFCAYQPPRDANIKWLT